MPESDLELLTRAAVAAGEIAKKHFKSSLDICEKDDGQGPVTQADLEIDQMLREELLSARPDYGWLSEETEDSPARLECDRVFIVDPIDGTRSFVNGDKTFAHSLAISDKKRTVTAVVYLPLLESCYASQAGKGASLNGQKILASNRNNMEGADILGTRPLFNPELWLGGVPNVNRHFRSSLAYRLCLVAQGSFDGMVTLRDTWEWDIAAGHAVLAAAGGSVRKLDDTPMTYGKAGFDNPDFIACGLEAATSE